MNDTLPYVTTLGLMKKASVLPTATHTLAPVSHLTSDNNLTLVFQPDQKLHFYHNKHNITELLGEPIHTITAEDGMYPFDQQFLVDMAHKINATSTNYAFASETITSKDVEEYLLAHTNRGHIGRERLIQAKNCGLWITSLSIYKINKIASTTDCHICKATKTNKQPTKDGSGLRPITPGHTISADGKPVSPTSKSGYSYMFLFKDIATDYWYIHLCSSKTSADYIRGAEAVRLFLNSYGYRLIALHTDSEINEQSHEVILWEASHGIHEQHSPPLEQNKNSSERAYQELIKITSAIHRGQSALSPYFWDLAVQAAAKLHNSNPTSILNGEDSPDRRITLRDSPEPVTSYGAPVAIYLWKNPRQPAPNSKADSTTTALLDSYSQIKNGRWTFGPGRVIGVYLWPDIDTQAHAIYVPLTNRIYIRSDVISIKDFTKADYEQYIWRYTENPSTEKHPFPFIDPTTELAEMNASTNHSDLNINPQPRVELETLTSSERQDLINITKYHRLLKIKTRLDQQGKSINLAQYGIVVPWHQYEEAAKALIKTKPSNFPTIALAPLNPQTSTTTVPTQPQTSNDTADLSATEQISTTSTLTTPPSPSPTPSNTVTIETPPQAPTLEPSDDPTGTPFPNTLHPYPVNPSSTTSIEAVIENLNVAPNSPIPQPPRQSSRAKPIDYNVLNRGFSAAATVPSHPLDPSSTHTSTSPIISTAHKRPVPRSVVKLVKAALGYRSTNQAKKTAIKLDNDNPTLKEALNSDQRDKWIEAINAELHTIKKNGTYEVVSRSDIKEGSEIIHSTLKLKVKRDPFGNVTKWKARLCARGDMQTEDPDDDIYSPTAATKSFNFLMNLAAMMKMKTAGCDITGAFLYADLEEPIYMYLPKELWTDGVPIIWKLKKSLYGLKEAPRLFYEHIRAHLLVKGYSQSICDPCVFFKYYKCDKAIFFSVHVDDSAIVSSTPEYINQLFTDLQSGHSTLNQSFNGYELTTDVPLTSHIGTNISHSSDSLSISQPGYIRNLIEAHGSKNKATLPTTPSTRAPPLDYIDSSGPCNKEDYAHIIGKLHQLPLKSRPDLTFSINYLASKLAHPTNNDMSGLIRIIDHLQITESLCLTYHRHPLAKGDGTLNKDLVKLKAFCDASFNMYSDSKSQSAFIITINEGASIYAYSGKQKRVTLSSTESEHEAIFELVKEISWWRNFLDELGFSQMAPTTIFEDNKSTITLCENFSGNQKRTKHYILRINYINEQVNNLVIQFEHLPTHKQIADILSKHTDASTFTSLRDSVLGTSTYRNQIDYAKSTHHCSHYADFVYVHSTKQFT